MPVDHWMTFGTFAEQRYFTYPSEKTYKGVIINANMLAHAPSGLAAFLLEKTRVDFPYIIDPLTHAFQHDVSILLDGKGRIKSSIENLASSYGDLIKRNVGIKSVTPDDFNNKDEFHNFIESCIKFQEDKLSKAIEDCDSFKYLRDFGETANVPYALVAPYFYMDELTVDDWLPVVVDSAKYTLQLKAESGIRIFSAVVVNQGILLEKELIDKIISSMSEVNVSGFLFWVDDLNENSTNRAVLKGFLKLAKGLRANGTREVINLHGGYFSVLSSSNEFGESAFSGVSHGPEFGEFRKIVPVGGGIPVAKFYIRQLHSRVDYREALRYFRMKGWLQSSRSFYEHICNCSECRDVIKDDPNNFTIYGISETKLIQKKTGPVSREFSIRETKEHCLKHYLNKKQEEYIMVSGADKKQLLDNLKDAEGEFMEVAGRHAVSHLNLWHGILSDS